MYVDIVRCLKVEKERFTWLMQTHGLKQRSSLSPVLFVVELDKIINAIRKKAEDKKIQQ